VYLFVQFVLVQSERASEKESKGRKVEGTAEEEENSEGNEEEE